MTHKGVGTKKWLCSLPLHSPPQTHAMATQGLGAALTRIASTQKQRMGDCHSPGGRASQSCLSSQDSCLPPKQGLDLI